MQQVAELGAGQPVWGAGKGGVDLFGERVPGGVVDCPGCGAGGVVPERKRSVEVLGADRAGAVEQRVDQREADRVRLGAGGELAGEPFGGVGELRVGVPPQLACVVGERDAAGALSVLERGREVADSRDRGRQQPAGAQSGAAARARMSASKRRWRSASLV